MLLEAISVLAGTTLLTGGSWRLLMHRGNFIGAAILTMLVVFLGVDLLLSIVTEETDLRGHWVISPSHPVGPETALMFLLMAVVVTWAAMAAAGHSKRGTRRALPHFSEDRLVAFGCAAVAVAAGAGILLWGGWEGYLMFVRHGGGRALFVEGRESAYFAFLVFLRLSIFIQVLATLVVLRGYSHRRLPLAYATLLLFAGVVALVLGTGARVGFLEWLLAAVALGAGATWKLRPSPGAAARLAFLAILLLLGAATYNVFLRDAELMTTFLDEQFPQADALAAATRDDWNARPDDLVGSLLSWAPSSVWERFGEQKPIGGSRSFSLWLLGGEFERTQSELSSGHFSELVAAIGPLLALAVVAAEVAILSYLGSRLTKIPTLMARYLEFALLLFTFQLFRGDLFNASIGLFASICAGVILRILVPLASDKEKPGTGSRFRSANPQPLQDE